MRGGLSYVLLGAMYLISGISGAKAADMAAIAPALVPEMRKRGIPDGELVSLLAASSAMSETIPPSLVLITVGAVTGVSIGALFTGGLLPALVLALMLCVVARYRSGKDIALAEKASWRAVGQAVLAAIPGLLLPLIIRTAGRGRRRHRDGGGDHRRGVHRGGRAGGVSLVRLAPDV